MRVITDYKICKGSETNHLSDAVRTALLEGWQPYGSGYSVVSTGSIYNADHVHYVQPMVKYEVISNDK